MFNSKDYSSSYLLSPFLTPPGATPNYYAVYNLKWSPDKSNSFFFFNRKKSIFGFKKGFFNTIPKVPDLNITIPDYWDSDNDETQLLPYYSLQKNNKNFIILKSSDTDKMILKTNHPDLVDFPQFNDSRNRYPIIEDPYIIEGIEVINVEVDYEPVIKSAIIFSSKLESSETKDNATHIFYTPDIWTELDENNKIIPNMGNILYHDKTNLNSFPEYSQFAPQFNYDGNLLAYINQDEVRSKFSLIIYTTSENSFSSDSYILADSLIYTIENKQDHSSTSLIMDYCWHPKKNILFYVALEYINEKEVRKIKYFDVDSNTSHYLEAETQLNGNISISQDGQYILVQSWGYFPGVKHFNNCKHFKKKYNNHQCCSTGENDVMLCLIKLEEK